LIGNALEKVWIARASWIWKKLGRRRWESRGAEGDFDDALEEFARPQWTAEQYEVTGPQLFQSGLNI
jgi:hypothetical protein